MLGIRLDTRLTWKPHISELEQVLSRSIYAVRRIRDIVGRDGAITAYHALFHSRMAYGIVLWGESSHAERILIVQKRAIRTIMTAPQGSHYRLFARLRILTATATYVFQQLVRARSQLATMNTRGDMTSANTRNKDDIDIPRHRIETSAAQHQHLRLLNGVPQEWRRLPMIAFKRQVKRMLLDGLIYSVEELLSHS